MDVILFSAVVLTLLFLWLKRNHQKRTGFATVKAAPKEAYNERFLPPIKPGHQLMYQRVTVAGCNHYREAFYAFSKEHEKSLKIQTEPTNKHDKNAIKVIGVGIGQEYHIGYLPRELSGELYSLGALPQIEPRIRFMAIETDGFLRLELDLTAPRELVKSARDQ